MSNDRHTVQVESANKGSQFLADSVWFVVPSPAGLVRVVEAFEVQCDYTEEAREFFDLKKGFVSINKEVLGLVEGTW